MVKLRMSKEEFETNLLLLGFRCSTGKVMDNYVSYRYTNKLQISAYGFNAINLRVNYEYIGSFNFELALEMIVKLLGESHD